MANTKTLKKNKEFKRVYSKGNFNIAKYLVLYTLRNGTNYNRLGISTGKKVGNSVTRNRLRRLVKENWREMEDLLQSGYDLVFVIRKSNDLPGYWHIKREMKYLLRKNKMWNGSRID